jgi:hypothetical protein
LIEINNPLVRQGRLSLSPGTMGGPLPATIKEEFSYLGGYQIGDDGSHRGDQYGGRQRCEAENCRQWAVAQAPRWDIRDNRRFMIVFGLVSSTGSRCPTGCITGKVQQI